jgi:peptide/nickel transport system permease protein
MFRKGSHMSIVWGRFRRNKSAVTGALIVVGFALMAILAPFLAPYDPIKQNIDESLVPPSIKHPFGCDLFGRDILSRVIHGARISLIVATLGVSLAAVLGTIIGAIAGYNGGIVDEVLMRAMDVLLAFPDIFLAIAIIAAVGPGLVNVILAISIYNLPQFSRVSRSSVLTVKEKEFIEAAKAIGESTPSILLRYILPNCLAPLIVLATLRMAASILTASGLSFLGLGVQPPTPEWGAMMSDARLFLRTAPHVGLFPGLALLIIILGFNMLGDGLNDALNPRLRD